MVEPDHDHDDDGHAYVNDGDDDDEDDADADDDDADEGGMGSFSPQSRGSPGTLGESLPEISIILIFGCIKQGANVMEKRFSFSILGQFFRVPESSLKVSWPF